MSAPELDATDETDLLADPDLPLLHTRNYEVRSWRNSDTEIRIRGRVRDVKPAGSFFAGDPDPMTIHDMVLEIIVELPSLVITDAKMLMNTHPHGECTDIMPHYQGLIGLNIARGFTHKVREGFGGPRGCTHTTALLQAMAPVAIQSIWAMMAPAEGETPVAITMEERRRHMEMNRNTCHVWADEGPMFSLLDKGEMIPPPIWGVERMEKLGIDPDDWFNRHAD